MQFVSLIDGLIGDGGSEVGRFSKELVNSREASSQLEAKLKIVEESHASETSQFEIRISDLERDLGKTASSLLKVKQEKKAKSSDVAMASVDGSLSGIQMVAGEGGSSPAGEEVKEQRKEIQEVRCRFEGFDAEQPSRTTQRLFPKRTSV
ncbi:hypothetical protein F2Q68_00015271 [Brassica cretica]|uniref:Uncharacterized protein n=1 Tax=Brassica cretica TaxID=69181 RepID=A0A8S9HP08_BRACR|nr:hypothetical protein F2Q68_00015271 [Brassica cretica]